MTSRKAFVTSLLATLPIAINEEVFGEVNLLSESPADRIVLVVSDNPDPIEQYAQGELVRHVQRSVGVRPGVIRAGDVAENAFTPGTNLLILGRIDDNRELKRLADARFFTPNKAEQGYSLRIDVDPRTGEQKRWLGYSRERTLGGFSTRCAISVTTFPIVRGTRIRPRRLPRRRLARTMRPIALAIRRCGNGTWTGWRNWSPRSRASTE